MTDGGNATLKQLLKWEVTGTKLITPLTVQLYFPADCDVQEVKREITYFFFRRILLTVFKLPIEMKVFRKSSFAIGNAKKSECDSPALYSEIMTKYVETLSTNGKFVDSAVLQFSLPFNADSCTSWMLMKTTFDLSPDLNPARLFLALVFAIHLKIFLFFSMKPWLMAPFQRLLSFTFRKLV